MIFADAAEKDLEKLADVLPWLPDNMIEVLIIWARGQMPAGWALESLDDIIFAGESLRLVAENAKGQKK